MSHEGCTLARKEISCRVINNIARKVFNRQLVLNKIKKYKKVLALYKTNWYIKNNKWITRRTTKQNIKNTTD